MRGCADVAGGWNCRNVIADPGEIVAAFNIARCEGYLALFRTLRWGEACAAPARRGAAKALYIGVGTRNSYLLTLRLLSAQRGTRRERQCGEQVLRRLRTRHD